ncbi:MAG: DMT family transporter [Hyphomicrobiales bacterium]|nr:DMT family transporter [Hyphomicrobiales bacterium]
MSTEPPKPKRVERVPLGIAFMIGATVMFASSSAIAKWQVALYPLGEVMVIRTLASLALCALIIMPRTGLAVFRTQKLHAHLLRGVSQGTAQTMIVLAFSMMPLASAFAINFSAPLFATLASAFFLKERVGPARWAALATGFLGVLVVTSPGSGTFQIGALFALTNAVLYGTVTAGVRGMTSTESAETLTMYQMVLLTTLFALMLPLGWATPTSADWMALLVSGAMNGIGQYWWTRALSLAPASAVSPFYYFMLVWAALLGFIFWGDLPTVSLVVGSAIVVGSGLFLLWREAGRV